MLCSVWIQATKRLRIPHTCTQGIPTLFIDKRLSANTQYLKPRCINRRYIEASVLWPTAEFWS
jgi:hypothetical protein